MNRTATREHAFKLIYSLEIQKQDNIAEAIELYIQSNEISDENAIKYISSTVLGIQKNQQTIIKQIDEKLKPDWKIERISKIDLAILKLAIYELQYTNVPFKVVINEAVEIAKKYGEDSSKNFVNGVLASIVNKEE